MSFYIDVLLPFPLKNFYTYEISEEEFKFINKGFRVLVPFGGKKVFTSIVIEKHKNVPHQYEPKDICISRRFFSSKQKPNIILEMDE